jgi:hypothetical protein
VTVYEALGLLDSLRIGVTNHSFDSQEMAVYHDINPILRAGFKLGHKLGSNVQKCTDGKVNPG